MKSYTYTNMQLYGITSIQHFTVYLFKDL